MLEKKDGRLSVIFSPEVEAQALEVFSYVVVISFYRGRPTRTECRAAISLWIDHSPYSVAVIDSRTILIRLRDEVDTLRVPA